MKRTCFCIALTLTVFSLLPTNVQAAPLPQPILRYSFDSVDISGTTVTDLGTGGNNGTIVGTVPNVPGRFGEALSFDGAASSTFVDVGTPLLSTTDASQPYTIAFWVNTTVSSMAGPFSQYTGSQATRWGIRMDSQGGRPSWWHGNDGERTRASTIVTDGAWHHLAFTKDSSQNLAVYIDGILDTDTGTFPDTDPAAFANINTQIGTFNTTSVLPYTGLIDEVFVFDTVLNDAEIFNLSNLNQLEVPEPSTGLLAAVGLAGVLRLRRRRSRR